MPKLNFAAAHRRQHPNLRRGLAILTLALVLAGLSTLRFPGTVRAAGCTIPDPDYGTDTLTLDVPAATTYNIWVRMEAPATTSDSILLQVDGTTCYSVGGNSSMTLNDWEWVDYQNGSTSDVMQATLSTGDHTLEFIGSETGVGVDEVLLISDPTCVPTGTGTNCTQPIPVTVPFFLQSGGQGFTDSQNNVWQADQYYSQNGPYGSGGTTGGDGTTCTTTGPNENCTANTITGTTNSRAFQYERWGNFQYDIPVNNGSYIVVLNFAEINPGSGTREFNVSLEGNSVLTNFNVGSTVGNYTADEQAFPVTISDGNLNITFTSINGENEAKVDSIEILPNNPPAIEWSAPASGATVSGSSVPLTAVTSDPVGIKNVSYTVNGNSVGTVSSSPYTLDWDSTSVVDGNYTIVAKATDEAGLTATASENITVANNVCSSSPTDPSNLTDTDSTPLPANKVDLSWTGSQAGLNCTLAGYHIYRNGSLLNSTTSTSYSDTTVSASTSYTYKVEAYDTSGDVSNLIPSSGLSVTTGPSCSDGSGSPTKPVGLAETGDSYTTITMSWSASSDSDGCTLSGYHVYRNSSYIGDSIGTNTSYSDSGLDSGTSYSYYVVAYDSGGNVSANSTADNMTTETDVVAPTIPTNFTGISESDSSISLSWGASTDLPDPGAVGMGGYYIYKNGSSSPTYTVSASATSYTDSSGISPSTTYSYTIAAYDKNGNISAQTSAINVKSGSTYLVDGDLNGDGKVNIFDLSIMLDFWGSTTATPAQGQLTGIGAVGITDLSIMLAHWTGGA